MNFYIFLQISIAFYVFLLGRAIYHYFSTQLLIRKIGPLLSKAVSPFVNSNERDLVSITTEKDATKLLEENNVYSSYQKLLSLGAKINSKLDSQYSSILINHDQTISYKQTIFENFKSIRSSYLELHDIRQNQILIIQQTFNPIYTIKFIFLLPAKILSWFGIDLNEIPARIFSLISFIVIFIFKNYGTEIFEWLSTLLK